MANKQYSEEDIRVIDAREFTRIRIIEPAEIDPLYVIMGTLQEYFGGYSLHEEIVDRYFADEQECGALVAKLCRLYLREHDLKDDVQFIKGEGGQSSVHSKKVCSVLAEYYHHTGEHDFLRKCYRLSEDDPLFKHERKYIGKDGTEFMYNYKKYSYLIGVILKNKLKDEPAINFANAGHKADYTVDFLRYFSAFADRSFDVKYIFNVPHVTRIILDVDNMIWTEVERYKQEIQNKL